MHQVRVTICLVAAASVCARVVTLHSRNPVPVSPFTNQNAAVDMVMLKPELNKRDQCSQLMPFIDRENLFHSRGNLPETVKVIVFELRIVLGRQ